METEQASDMLDQLPPEVAPYVIVAVIIWWLTRATYKDSSQGQAQLLDRYEVRFKQLEGSLSNVSQDLEAKNKKLDEKNEELEAKNGELGKLRVEVAELRDAIERAEAAEGRCTERMEQLERRYERRIEELEREIDQLRVELSEPIAVEQL